MLNCTIYYVDMVDIAIGAVLVLVLIIVAVYDYFEITAMKYCILKAMAAQSKAVEMSLHNLLKTRNDFKLLNRDFKNIEKIYLTSLNDYLIQRSDSDGRNLRREIFKKENLEL